MSINYSIWSLFGPASWPIWCLIAAAITAKSCWSRRWLALGVGLVVLLGVLPSGYWLMRALEMRFPPEPVAASVRDIVVLAGGERLDASALSGRLELNEHGDRILAGAMLANAHPGARLWIIGGVRRLRFSSRSDAEWDAEAWRRLGIDAARIQVVNGTLDTCANAAGVAARKPAGRPLLVTSAFHMPRAIACFRKAGLDPLPYPADYQSWPYRGLGSTFSLNIIANLRRADLALHEWVGLVYYWLKGRTGEIWPGPR